MAIINRTPDSFFDQGSAFELDRAVDAAIAACHSCESGLVAGTIDYRPHPLECPADCNLLICCLRRRSDVIIDVCSSIIWKGALMATRKAHARWEGSIKDGKGQVDFGNGAFKSAYSFNSRFEDGKGTNPEELLGAAHASCFAMAMSLVLGGAGFKPDYIDATAHVTILPQDGGFRITKSHLVCEAAVPGIDVATFAKHAEAAKAGCPVSQALAGTTITLDAKLAR